MYVQLDLSLVLAAVTYVLRLKKIKSEATTGR